MLATTVVISTYNRPEGVARLLYSLVRQNRMPESVVVVDQSKKPHIKHAIDAFYAEDPRHKLLRVRHFSVDFQGLTKSRNFGVEQVTTPVTTFIDDDVEVGTDYIQRVLDFFKSEKGMVLGGIPWAAGMGRKLPKTGKVWTAYRKLFSLGYEDDAWRVLPSLEGTTCLSLQEAAPAEYISGSNFSVITEVARKIRFDEKLVWYSIGEDLDFPMRVRREHPDSVWIDPNLPVAHYYPTEDKSLSEFLLLVHTCHYYYLFKKHWDYDRQIGSALKFAWSRLGYSLMPFLQTRKAGLLPNPSLLMRSLKVEGQVLLHLRNVFKGKFPIKL